MKTSTRSLYPKLAVLAAACLASVGALAAAVPGKIIAQGPTYAFVGQPIEGSLATYVGTSTVPLREARVLWQILSRTRAVIAEGDSHNYFFTPTAAGTYTLSVKTYVPSENPTTANWVQATIPLQAAVPNKPAVVVKGPPRSGFELDSVFVADVKPTFALDKSSLKLSGVWVLPDGQTSPGTISSDGKPMITFTPPVTASPANYRIGYRAFFEGYSDATSATGYATTQSWSYQFPTWTMTSAVSGPAAPAGVKLTLKPSDPVAAASLRGLVYEWNVPQGVNVTGTPGSILNGALNFGGTFPITVTVKDSVGFSQTLTSNVTVAPPPPIKLTLTGVRTSKWKHNPVNMTFTAKTSGGTPGDPANQPTIHINGEPVTTVGGVAKVTLPNAGVYSVMAGVSTQSGAVADAALHLTVPEADIPTCTITASQPSPTGVINFVGSCKSETSNIVRYSWSLGDRVIGTNNRLSYKYTPGSGGNLVLTGLSDGNRVGTALFEDWPN